MQVLLLCITICFALVASHSYMTEPQPQTDFSGGCRVGNNIECPGPCESFRKYKPRFFGHSVKTWQRGQQVTIRWTRNNHVDGFVRLALVPIKDMNSKSKHAEYTFGYYCWDGPSLRQEDCKRRSVFQSTNGGFRCGSDGREGQFKGKQPIVFAREVRVPRNAPDGEYVLGWTWFGGSLLGNYHSCSRVTIRGGAFQQTEEVRAQSCKSQSGDINNCVRELTCSYKNPKSHMPKGWFQGKTFRYPGTGGNRPPPPPPPMNNGNGNGNNNGNVPKLNAPGNIPLRYFSSAEDKTAGNQGGSNCAPKNNGANRVDMSGDGDTCSVGWIQSGESLTYEIHFQEGNYDVEFEVASAVDGTKTFTVSGFGRSVQLSLGSTGGWGNFQQRKASLGYVSGGKKYVKIYMNSNLFNIRSFKLIRTGGNGGNNGNNGNNCPKRDISSELSNVEIVNQPVEIARGGSVDLTLDYKVVEASVIQVTLWNNWNPVTTSYAHVEAGASSTNVTIAVPSDALPIGHFFTTKVFPRSLESEGAVKVL